MNESIRADLEPVVEQLLERHLRTAREWFPHEFVPWSRGRDFTRGAEWRPRGADADSVARVALWVNLLTEDNLPYYFRTLDQLGRAGAWGEWTRRWTAEEGRHAIVIRDYLTVTRLVDPVALERARMRQVSQGVAPEFDNVWDALVYTTLQELATRISHRNTGKLLADASGRDIMSRVAADENLHHLFYRDVASTAVDLHPSEMVLAMERTIRNFEMPGTGIAGFAQHARRMAQAGIYDFGIYHDQILVPVVLGRWRLAALDGLNTEAETARDRLLAYIERLGAVARRLENRRGAAAKRSPDPPSGPQGALLPAAPS